MSLTKSPKDMLRVVGGLYLILNGLVCVNSSPIFSFPCILGGGYLAWNGINLCSAESKTERAQGVVRLIRKALVEQQKV